jgi:hypothetical protein
MTKDQVVELLIFRGNRVVQRVKWTYYDWCLLKRSMATANEPVVRRGFEADP